MVELMLAKFSKQIANSFAEAINTNVSSKPCQTSEMEFFSASRYWLHRQTQNLPKYLGRSVFQK